MRDVIAFLPELVFAGGAIVLFVLSLGNSGVRAALRVTVGIALTAICACVVALRCEGALVAGAYRIDFFSQLLKLIFSVGYLAIALISNELPDIRADVKPEYFMFLTLSVAGLVVLMSAVELVTFVISLELVSLPLYALVAMRREDVNSRVQMESAIKYVAFGIAATGLMLFGMSYLYALTGTTALDQISMRLVPVINAPLPIVGLVFALAGLFFKLAVFPFHFWTPDVYQGGSNETTALVASLPKLGAAAVLVRFVALAGNENRPMVVLLSLLAMCSMFYGNLIALVQKDLKRLFGFSAIAHAGYALIGFVTLEQEGYTAALYYMVSYVFMMLACFVVLCRTASGGENLALENLAGLHQRSPLLAITLLVGAFGLAGVPPFAGFMGKFILLKAAFAKGYIALVLVTILNSALAVYYYLLIVREAFLHDPVAVGEIQVGLPTKVLCISLVAAILWLGIWPGFALEQLGECVRAAIASRF